MAAGEGRVNFLQAHGPWYSPCCSEGPHTKCIWETQLYSVDGFFFKGKENMKTRGECGGFGNSYTGSEE